MTIRLFAICLCILGSTVSSAIAQDASCMFAANAPATVYIEYAYVTAEGSGTSRGSGFVVTPEGHVITNAHVVSPPLAGVAVQSASVKLRVGSILNPVEDAEVIVRDPSVDLALLKLKAHAEEGKEWPSVTVGSSTNLPVGAPLMALGFAGGDVALVPGGTKTASNTVVDNQLMPWWQTDLALNHGNSGGPIFGELGTVVGIAVAKSENSQLVTHIIPILRAQHLFDAAGVTTQRSGRCAQYPECRHETHGLEGYAIQEARSQWGDWRGGGYNRAAACNDFLTQLKRDHPVSQFEFVSDNEETRDTGFRQIQYRYYCEYLRKEQPIYNKRRSPACLE
ncbi:trypsin-like serine protease [Rhizobium laguerreae]|uniref:S1C family serine protease n=1 Tax=Rhizobium laguerreae TaxID=1076926 RepID=UPI001C8FFD5D|nr:serine protease [Rhizobium laguerreae]MBY3329007.1 trypsin-like serine protease [Rhizobium laguerreae]MBY3392085.1 trypsin-like serine protease [Rhizobium laguerreae]